MHLLRCTPLFVSALALMFLSACGGGGSSASSDPNLLRIEAVGQGQPLFAAGQPASSPVDGVRLNQRLLLSFGGRVDVTSLPGWGSWMPGEPPPGLTDATGSIEIFTDVAGAMRPARGLFEVQDDPSLPAGNRRRVVFTPAPPSDPESLSGSAGFLAASLYTIRLQAGGGQATVSIDGQPLANAVMTQFGTCDAALAGGTLGCFLDGVPGVPFVLSTSPLTSDPAPLAVVPASQFGAPIRLVISEDLLPFGVNAEAVRIVNAASGGAVAGSLTLFQVGSPEAGPANAILEFRPLNPLSPNQTYEILVGAALQDFVGQPLALYDPSDPARPASGRRLFRTASAQSCAAAPFVEDFGPPVPGNPSITVAGSGEIDRTAGRFVGLFPIETIGDGSFGPMSFPTGPSTLDTGAATTTGFENGVWNALALNVPEGATVRIVGTRFPAHIRCLRLAVIEGTIDGSAGSSESTLTPIGSPEQGSRAGNPNQGGPSQPAIVAGGVGGVGAGKGGDASQQGLDRTEVAQSGFGPAVNGAPDPGPLSSNPLTYGGGAGGDSDRNQFPMLLGGIGGAGGSAFEAGGNGQPRTALTLGCEPIAPPSQPISLATGIPPVFVPPISQLSGGSGGGGGGDRHDNASLPALDDQGGSGGGGGGGFRLSSLNGIAFGPSARIRMEGDSGSTGNVLFGGDGGGGSGGQIWLQSHGSIFISTSTVLSVAGGAANSIQRCNNQASGAGGIGLIQLEALNNAAINTNFVGAGNGAHVITTPFPFINQQTGRLQATAQSDWFDTGTRDPDYLGATIALTPNAASCTNCNSVLIEFQGAFEDASGARPDLLTATPFAPAAAGQTLDALDGRRFFRYRITLNYDTPIVGTAGIITSGTTPTTPLPSVDRIEVRYATAAACP